MVDDELRLYGREFWLESANFHKQRVALRRCWTLTADWQCAVENPDDVLTERSALAVFFAD
jgi:hypothetical protein